MQTQDTYTSKVCKHCKREMILITKEMEQALKEGRYLACTYCGSQNLKDTDKNYGIDIAFKNDEKAR